MQLYAARCPLGTHLAARALRHVQARAPPLSDSGAYAATHLVRSPAVGWAAFGWFAAARQRPFARTSRVVALRQRAL